jgi:molecular chaperone GrpE (heat shock protein)
MNDDALDRGREMFRDMAQRHREAARDLASQRKTLHELGLAAVEAHELLGDAVDQYAEDLPAEAREALDLVRRAARERLERAGLRLDGLAGEALDLSRHRVVKSRRRTGIDGPRVTTVVRGGVLLGETRLRAADVVIDEPEAR